MRIRVENHKVSSFLPLQLYTDHSAFLELDVTWYPSSLNIEMRIPLEGSKFQLNTAGIAGLLGGDDALVTMDTVFVYEDPSPTTLL